MGFLYTLSIHFYHFGILIASIFNKKAGLWVEGRKGLFDALKSKINPADGPVWFHCASLGEFEQGRTIIENLRERKPGVKILLTFFSPSGYEIRKNYSGADYIFYLPVDTPSNARRFIEAANPSAAFFVKYEFWFNYLKALNKQRVPVYYVSANFRPSQHFFKWYGGWFRKQLKTIRYFFVQNTTSQELLKGIGIKNVLISGDTRFDRVTTITTQAKDLPLIKLFKNEHPLLIAGSTWKEDEELIAGVSPQTLHDLKIVIAPHEIKQENIRRIQSLFQNALLFSEANENNVGKASVLIIDNIGLLSSLYRYGHVAYIGGGFGKGIHNILEAATFGVPVIFGPNFSKFNEANELVRLGGAFPVRNRQELEANLDFLLSQQMVWRIASEVSKGFVISNKGATEKILNSISSENS